MDQNSKKEAPEREHKLLEFREEEKKPVFTPKVKKEIREWAVSLAVAIVSVLLIRSFLFTIIRVDGPSMMNTLQNGDRLMVNVLTLKMDGPQRFDVVILHYPNKSEQYVKRVIGLPGETLEVRGGVLYIDGEAISEPFLDDELTEKFDLASRNIGPIEIPEGQYYVMGDNRDNSNDSRAVGLIDESMFIGKVRYILWPLDRAGEVSGSEVYGE